MISKISATQLLKQTAEISGEKTEQKSLTMLELALDIVVLLQQILHGRLHPPSDPVPVPLYKLDDSLRRQEEVVPFGPLLHAGCVAVDDAGYLLAGKLR